MLAVWDALYMGHRLKLMRWAFVLSNFEQCRKAKGDPHVQAVDTQMIHASIVLKSSIWSATVVAVPPVVGLFSKFILMRV